MQHQQLSQATIVIKQIYDNGEKQPSKIIDGEGQYWKIWPDVLGQLNLKKDTTYEIKFKPGEYNGKPDNVIKSAARVEESAQPNGHAQTNGHVQPVARNDHPSGPMGLANAFISIGAVAADEDAIASLIIKCRKGHKKGWAAEI